MEVKVAVALSDTTVRYIPGAPVDNHHKPRSQSVSLPRQYPGQPQYEA
jgi:hypothetical protein